MKATFTLRIPISRLDGLKHYYFEYGQARRWSSNTNFQIRWIETYMRIPAYTGNRLLRIPISRLDGLKRGMGRN